MSHVTHMNESSHTYERVMSHIWMNHVTHNDESCHTYDHVMSHIWMSHVTHMDESCPTYEWVTCHTHEWVMSHLCMSLVPHVDESCHTYEWVIPHVCTSLTLLPEFPYKLRCSGRQSAFCLFAWDLWMTPELITERSQSRLKFMREQWLVQTALLLWISQPINQN